MTNMTTLGGAASLIPATFTDFPDFQPPIPLMTLSYLVVRLGMLSRSTPMALTSMARTCPPIGMCSSTLTTVAFLARKFTARQTYQSYRLELLLRQTLIPPAVLTAGTYWIEIQAQHDLRYARRVGLE